MFKLFIRQKENKKVNPNNIDTWIVRWNQRYGNYSDEYKEVARFFISEEEAKEFRDELLKAMKLLGHTANHLNKVSCKRVDDNKM